MFKKRWAILAVTVVVPLAVVIIFDLLSPAIGNQIAVLAGTIFPLLLDFIIVKVGLFPRVSIPEVIPITLVEYLAQLGVLGILLGLGFIVFEGNWLSGIGITVVSLFLAVWITKGMIRGSEAAA